jgi:hypothetical protein
MRVQPVVGSFYQAEKADKNIPTTTGFNKDLKQFVSPISTIRNANSSYSYSNISQYISFDLSINEVNALLSKYCQDQYIPAVFVNSPIKLPSCKLYNP